MHSIFPSVHFTGSAQQLLIAVIKIMTAVIKSADINAADPPTCSAVIRAQEQHHLLECFSVWFSIDSFQYLYRVSH